MTTPNNFAEAVTRAAHLNVFTAARRFGRTITYYPNGKPKKTVTAVVTLDGEQEREIGVNDRVSVQLATIVVAVSEIEDHRDDQYEILGDGHRWNVDLERSRTGSSVVLESAAGAELRGLATIPLWRYDPIEMTSEGLRRRHG